MANVSIVKLKVRRGTDAQRQLITLDVGELGFTTDTNRLFVGDGATVGGISPAIKFYSTNQLQLTAYAYNAAPIQLGDIIYDAYTSSFYTLTGTPNTAITSYKFLPILTTGNASSILPYGSGGLAPGSLWINTNNKQKVLSIV